MQYYEYKRDRGLYLDFVTNMPSGIINNENELLAYIKGMDYQRECEKTRTMIKAKLLEYGGNATKKCAELLLKD